MQGKCLKQKEVRELSLLHQVDGVHMVISAHKEIISVLPVTNQLKYNVEKFNNIIICTETETATDSTSTHDWSIEESIAPQSMEAQQIFETPSAAQQQVETAAVETTTKWMHHHQHHHRLTSIHYLSIPFIA